MSAQPTYKHPNNHAWARLFCWLWLTALSFNSQNISAADDFLSQVQTLQNQAHIEIVGLEKIQNGDKIAITNNLDQQIKQLFAGYNHIVSRNRKGKIERIVIVNKKEKAKDNGIQVATRLKDNHTTMPVSLSGDGRNWLTLDMVIDTGADTVVLPESLLNPLGLSNSQFKVSNMQTANGIIKAKLGTLAQINIAGEIIDNVEAAFIPDRLLGETKLLGMNALGRFQVNIDSNASLITLIKK